jgi:hypothetical protein
MSASRLPTALLTLRLSVFAVMLVWTLDKFVNPEHAARVYARFYSIGGLGPTAFQVIGVLELALLAGFVLGWRKRLTYGAVFVLHATSTLSSWEQYLAPFDHLLFFAAWPMLAACFTLYVLRDQDTKLTL